MSGGLISSGWRRSGVGERDLWHHRVAHERPITKCALHPAELSVCQSFYLGVSVAPGCLSFGQAVPRDPTHDGTLPSIPPISGLATIPS